MPQSHTCRDCAGRDRLPALTTPRPAPSAELVNPAGHWHTGRCLFLGHPWRRPARPGLLATRGRAAAMLPRLHARHDQLGPVARQTDLFPPNPHRLTNKRVSKIKPPSFMLLPATARLIPSRRPVGLARTRRIILIMTAASPRLAVQRANRRPIKNLPGHGADRMWLFASP